MISNPYESCRLCGRSCRIDRSSGGRGFCGESAAPRVAMAGIHAGEEPPISGRGGSGAVFFTGCALKCAFCQNRQLSRGSIGRAVGPDELAGIFLELERRGVENINLVTPTHFAPAIAEAAAAARAGGLFVPILWNSSGYDAPQALDIAEGFVDLFLPDLKTLDPEMSQGLFGAADYPETAAAAVLRMASMRPLRYAGGMLVSGVVLRHLVMPGRLDSSRAVIDWFAAKLAGRALFSLMCQYTPVPGADLSGLPFAADRRLGRAEWEEILAYARRSGIEDGFMQELRPENEDPPLPDFGRREPFPRSLASTVWSASPGL